MYKFGNTSIIKLNTAHIDLQKIFYEVIKRSKVDFGISEGHRSIERQNKLFRQGKSKIDGIIRKGKHNYFPSRAVDIYIYHNNASTRKKIIYETNHLSYIAGLVDAVSKEFIEKGIISHKIRWGGNWDSDGVILFDQNFDDLPHFELKKI